MKRWTLAASVTLAVSMPAAAAAKTVAPQHAREYSRLYQQVARQFGHRAPGRNIVRWGFAPGQGVTDGQVVTSIGVLARMLAPPPPPRPTIAAPTRSFDPAPANLAPSHTASRAVTSSSSMPACTWQPESGGNPAAVNPSSGAGGFYQIMPSTWQAYRGTGSPQSAPMSAQTAVAQRIYQSQGRGAWSNC